MLNNRMLYRFVFITVTFIAAIFITSPLRAQAGQSVQDKRYEKEIGSLYQQKSIKAALQHFVDLEAETMRDLITITEIPAPPFKESIRAAKFLQMLRDAGADSVWLDEAGNVIGLRKGTTRKKTVVMDAHLDTVFPEGTDVTVKQRGDTLFAPGIGDDSRGLAVLLAILKTLQKTNIKTEADILFVGTVGEEGLGDLKGVKALFNNGSLSINSYIGLDVEGANLIVNGGVGSLRYRITFQGPGGHSFGDFGFVNPHNALARSIHYFVQEADRYTREGIPTTYNVGVISGGSSVNAIPASSTMEVDMRSEDTGRLKVLDGFLQDAVQRGLKEENEMKRKGVPLKVDVTMIGDRPAGVHPVTLPLVQRAIASVKMLGLEPKLILVSTNANIPVSRGIPAITIGVGGRGEGAHSLKEWWLNDKGYLGMQNAFLILMAEAVYKK
jgi:acetylornithine deacetylase/succinyl-diaminopimelate desuccinylase-like protein